MPNELRLYVLEPPEVEKVFNQPSFNKNDSLNACYKLEIKSHIKGFILFEFWYMKQLASVYQKFNILYNSYFNSLSIYLFFSPMNQKDETDADISNLVFDVNNKERPPWRCCSNSTVPRSEVIFFVQVSIIVLRSFFASLLSFYYQKSVKRDQLRFLFYQV